MSDLTDGLRLLADFLDGGRESFDFIRKDIKRQLRIYGTELRARAHLLKYKEEYDAVDLAKIDGTTKLEERKNDRFKTDFAWSAREEPWWYRDFDRTRNSRNSGRTA